MSAPAEVVAAGWGHLPFFARDWPGIAARLASEPGPVLPPEAQRFAALALTPVEAVRVVILGQDPYPTPGHANGLAFSVAPGVALPRSLANIYREMEGDIGARPADGDLSHWARQGVLLLNTALSVPAGAAGAHAKWGWDRLAAEVLAEVSARRRAAFLLWGAHAQKVGAAIVAPPAGAHLRIETAHPSPLSARRGFFGSRPFSRVNAWLAAQGEVPVDWAG
ncbi:uracil-DNA glycosylase [Frigidibacter albus]|uniref:Uracil-DNA glycosylase n=1 Tax=Frigidibacter albus TaxID=1465486 RepID=A0A6L8VHJ2_9RHOB|nr:uracil-DNA glycosylase [Frigidibacter albus]MZQ89908.1 uracil-DNA glycosylase [Frigidibacter albus]NBE31717.1 uracil-DNA glycosylase [Frigidibacter albus]GGH56051.1 uracil-DNA glycosylase [Frigidibacter albus]